MFEGNGVEKLQERLATTISALATEMAALEANCLWLSGTRRHDWRKALLAHNNQPHYVAILLTLLPNMRSVTVRGMCDDCEPFMEMIWAVVKANRDQSSAVHERAVSAGICWTQRPTITRMLRLLRSNMNRLSLEPGLLDTSRDAGRVIISPCSKSKFLCHKNPSPNNDIVTLEGISGLVTQSYRHHHII